METKPTTQQPNPFNLYYCNGGCGYPLRPAHTLLRNYPGTLADGGKGYCQACIRVLKNPNYKARPKFNDSLGTPCADCGKPLRPKGTLHKNHPGTVAHACRGLCTTCYPKNPSPNPQANRRTPIGFPERPAGLNPTDSHNYTATRNYIEARRHRGIPNDGIDLTTWRIRSIVTD